MTFQSAMTKALGRKKVEAKWQPWWFGGGLAQSNWACITQVRGLSKPSLVFEKIFQLNLPFPNLTVKSHEPR